MPTTIKMEAVIINFLFLNKFFIFIIITQNLVNEKVKDYNKRVWEILI